MAEGKTYIAEDVPWYSVGKGEEGPWRDEDVCMSGPTIFGKKDNWQDAYLLLSEKLAEYAKFNHVRLSGDSPMMAIAAMTMAAAAQSNYNPTVGIRVHGRYYRVREQ